MEVVKSILVMIASAIMSCLIVLVSIPFILLWGVLMFAVLVCVLGYQVYVGAYETIMDTLDEEDTGHV